MRIFRNTWFTRFAAQEGITDGELRDMINQLEAGQAEANLGGGVYKLRLARGGEGKSGGYRVIVVFKSRDRTFFRYGFAKSFRGNINEKELRNHKKAAHFLLNVKATAYGRGPVIWLCLKVFSWRNCGGVAIKSAIHHLWWWIADFKQFQFTFIER